MKGDTIFSTHNLYPYSGKIKEHYKALFDEVFVALLPFTTAETEEKNVSLEQPIEHEKPITWEQVLKESGLQNKAEILRALKTEIGAVRPIFMKMELKDKLQSFCLNNAVNRPEEGTYDLFSKVSMFRTFQLLGKKRVVISNEFYEKTITLDLEQLTELEFANAFEYDDYYVYSEDLSLLFALQFDSFHFLIATTKEQMEKILEEKLFEGFLCDDRTENSWEYEEGDLKTLLNEEQDN